MFTERASNEFVAADPNLRDRLEHGVALTARFYDGTPADVSKATLSVTASYEGRSLSFPEVEVITRPD